MGTSETTTEILVHITAPSRASDDIRYRQFATEYLAFQPTRIVERPKDATIEAHQRSPDDFVSPQASFRSVWDNVNSPSLATRKEQSNPQSSVRRQIQAESQKEYDSQASWIAPPSEVPDSMPYNDVSVPAFCTPTKVLNYYLQTTEPPSGSPAGSSGQLPERSGNIFSGAVPQEAYDTVVFSGEFSSRPSRSSKKRPRCVGQTPSPAEPKSLDVICEGRPCHTPSSAVRASREGLTPAVALLPEAGFPLNRIQATRLSREDIRNTTIIPSTQLGERAESEPPSSKRLKRNPAKGEVQALGRSASDVQPRGSEQGTGLQPESPEEDEERESHVLENPDWSHLLQIISDEPSVANHSLGPRPPMSLERLAEDMEIKRRYRPRYRAREMRPYERGYWLVKLDGWGHHEKVACWGFLGNWIRRDGNAGWGTRACRDESWSWMRLYGWEHIAGELYILLYVASYRLLKCMELRFHDGAGDVLVIVGARSDRRSLG